MSFLTRAFSGGAPQVQFQPSGFTNPTGFSVSGGGNVSRSPSLASNIGNLQSTFQAESGAFGNLAKLVAPGFSAFRQAGLRDITNTFRRASSNLRDTLAQRRVLGSSFANSAFSQQAADEAQAKANFEADATLKEIDATNQLIQEQYQAQSQSYLVAINQSNIESQLAAELTSKNNQIMAGVAEANAQLSMDTITGNASLVGTILGAGARIAAGRGGSSGG